jgi:hypothetical protein
VWGRARLRHKTAPGQLRQVSRTIGQIDADLQPMLTEVRLDSNFHDFALRRLRVGRLVRVCNWMVGTCVQLVHQLV